MKLDLDAMDKLSSKKMVKSEWRTFKLEGSKVRLKIYNINRDQYRIAQERLIEQLRCTMHSLTDVSDIEETQFAKMMKAVAYHLVEDFEGFYDRVSGEEIPFTHSNMATILTYSGDLGVALHAWILTQAQDIQNILVKEVESQVGKPFSIIDTIEKDSAEKKQEPSEENSENQN